MNARVISLVMALALALEVAFWAATITVSREAALAALVALPLLAVVGSVFMRRLSYMSDATSAIVASSDPGSASAREVLTDLARSAGVPAPAIEVGADGLGTGGASTSLGGGRALIRVSRRLADGDPRLLKAVLAHELGHVVLPASRLTSVGPAAWMLVAAIAYDGCALVAPGILWIPKMGVFLLPMLAATMFTVFADERRADRFAVALTGDASALLEYLSMPGVDRLTAMLHRPRVHAVRAMVGGVAQ